MKRKNIRSLIWENHLDFIVVQETKREMVDDRLCWSLWGNDDCAWCFFPSIGSSGGILSIRDSSRGGSVFTFSGYDFVGVCLEWGAQETRCIVVNVYCRCDISNKRRLWGELEMFKGGLGEGHFGAC